MAKLSVVSLSDAEKVVLVLDNLNIHSPASLYTAFEPKEAKRIAEQVRTGVVLRGEPARRAPEQRSRACWGQGLDGPKA
jgi:hypothetical protein